MTITTKKGDGGYTDFGGKRVKKDSLIIEAIGTLDELQAVLLLVGLEEVALDIGRIMSGKKPGMGLDKEIEVLEKEIKPVTKFMIFKDKPAMLLNWARTIARRAERYMVNDIRYTSNDKRYMNRLSDYLYLLALREEQRAVKRFWAK